VVAASTSLEDVKQISWHWRILLVNENCNLASQYLDDCIKSWRSYVVQAFALSILHKYCHSIADDMVQERQTYN